MEESIKSTDKESADEEVIKTLDRKTDSELDLSNKGSNFSKELGDTLGNLESKPINAEESKEESQSDSFDEILSDSKNSHKSQPKEEANIDSDNETNSENSDIKNDFIDDSKVLSISEAAEESKKREEESKERENDNDKKSSDISSDSGESNKDEDNEGNSISYTPIDTTEESGKGSLETEKITPEEEGLTNNNYLVEIEEEEEDKSDDEQLVGKKFESSQIERPFNQQQSQDKESTKVEINKSSSNKSFNESEEHKSDNEQHLSNTEKEKPDNQQQSQDKESAEVEINKSSSNKSFNESEEHKSDNEQHLSNTEKEKPDNQQQSQDKESAEVENDESSSNKSSNKSEEHKSDSDSNIDKKENDNQQQFLPSNTEEEKSNNQQQLLLNDNNNQNSEIITKIPTVQNSSSEPQDNFTVSVPEKNSQSDQEKILSSRIIKDKTSFGLRDSEEFITIGVNSVKATESKKINEELRDILKKNRTHKISPSALRSFISCRREAEKDSSKNKYRLFEESCKIFADRQKKYLEGFEPPKNYKYTQTNHERQRTTRFDNSKSKESSEGKLVKAIEISATSEVERGKNNSLFYRTLQAMLRKSYGDKYEMKVEGSKCKISRKVSTKQRSF